MSTYEAGADREDAGSEMVSSCSATETGKADPALSCRRRGMGASSIGECGQGTVLGVAWLLSRCPRAYDDPGLVSGPFVEKLFWRSSRCLRP